jgi:DNA-directed RNA polymerase subunit RPC12/RpoP
VKVQAKCDTCGRTFLLSQIGPDSDAPGRCPFCGARFARHYTATLMAAVRDVEIETARFVRALSRLQAMETGFDLDLEGLLQSLTEQVRSHEKAVP